MSDQALLGARGDRDRQTAHAPNHQLHHPTNNPCNPIQQPPRGKYSAADRVAADVALVWSNCFEFNDEDAEFYRWGGDWGLL
jgi:hypothetical protein